VPMSARVRSMVPDSDPAETLEHLQTPEQVAGRFQLTLDLFEAGEEMMRLNLKRRFPEASGQEIERRLITWLQESPIG